MQELAFEEKVTLSPIMEEYYRRLRTNLEFTGTENRVICVTSYSENDGKSTVSYYLACALAKDGKRTVFVDADLRNSVLHHRNTFDKYTIGLSHYLSGMKDLQETIYETNIKNLYLIPTGVRPKNPAELLGKSRFEKMIDSLKKDYDYVIIDTPPIGAVIDPVIVASKSDASMLVIASGSHSRKYLKRVIEDLKTANRNFLGVVLNKVEANTGRYGYGKKYGYGYGGKYGYGYSYGYGYGYGSGYAFDMEDMDSTNDIKESKEAQIEREE